MALLFQVFKSFIFTFSTLVSSLYLNSIDLVGLTLTDPLIFEVVEAFTPVDLGFLADYLKPPTYLVTVIFYARV